jgi:hypothetical protein
VFLQAFRLAEQQELGKPNLIDLVRQLLARMRQSRGKAADQLYGPLEVIGVVMSGFQRTEQRVIFQPMGVKIAELFIGGLQFRVRPGAEISPSCFEDPSLERDDGVIVNH